MKLMMHGVCPTLFLAGSALLVIGIIFSQNIQLYALSGAASIGALGVFATSKKSSSFFSSFALHQIYLIIGLISASRKSVFWKTIDRKTVVSS